MAETAQKRALKNYRKRLAQSGLARFEVMGLNSDRQLIRSLARQLADPGPAAVQIRTVLCHAIVTEPAPKGGVLAALRRSPLVGADLEFPRSVTDNRKVRL